MITQILNIFRRNLLKKLIALIAASENGRMMRHPDGQTLAVKIRPAFSKKEDKFFAKVLSKWRGGK